VFVLLWKMYWDTNKKKQPGYLFGFFFASLWSVRFAVEFLKEAQIDERGAWLLNTGQLLSIPLIFIGAYFMRKAKQTKQ
jgi:phosphatidylglycerol:prolipoprotein diacylglycerol transferase